MKLAIVAALVGSAAAFSPSSVTSGASATALRMETAPEDVAEAFLRLLRDPNLRETVSRGGQALARAEFSMDEVAKRHMELYEKVSGGSAAP